MEQKKVPISVVIMTKNVDSYIQDCLESVKWAAEIMIVDYQSADKTLEIARRYTDTIYFDVWDNEGAVRNRSYAKAKHEWVFTLDADERVSEELRQSISDFLTKGTEYDAFSVPIKNIFAGKQWIRYGGWYPAYKVRLFKKAKFHYEEAEIHPRVFLDGKEGRLRGDIIHHCYTDFTHLMTKVNAQTTLEAKKWLRDKRPMNARIAFTRVFSRFFKMFIQKQGYRDGFLGFMIAWQVSTYQLLSYAKYWQMKKMGSGIDTSAGSATLSYTATGK